MAKIINTKDEANRLSDLKELNILETPLSKSFERITRLTKALFNTPIVAISIIDKERQWFKSIQGIDVCETSREVAFCQHTILQDDLYIINNALTSDLFSDNPLVTGSPFIRFYAGCPIKSKQGHKIGALCIIDKIERQYTNDELESLKDMAGLVEAELNSQKKNHIQAELISELDEAKRKSMIDSLTRLWNRGGIETILTKQIALTQAQKTPFGLVLLDIDNFKHINDTYGHSAGDHVLRTLAKLLLNTVRDQDSIGRWGGEEFLIVMNTSDKETLLKIIERARKKIEKTPCIFEDKKIKVTFTAGVTLVSPTQNVVLGELIKKVDKGLYIGKNDGKNKLIFME